MKAQLLTTTAVTLAAVFLPGGGPAFAYSHHAAFFHYVPWHVSWPTRPSFHMFTSRIFVPTHESVAHFMPHRPVTTSSPLTAGRFNGNPSAPFSVAISHRPNVPVPQLPPAKANATAQLLDCWI